MMHQSLIQKDDWNLGIPALVHWSSKTLRGQTPLGVHLSMWNFVYFWSAIGSFFCSYLFWWFAGPTSWCQTLGYCSKFWYKPVSYKRPTPKMIVILFGLVGTSQFITLSTMSGFADIPSADSMCPRKTMQYWKKWHFLDFIFKLNSSIHLNTNSMWSNILSMLVANRQILSRYNRSVTNCLSPRHISMRWQKLDLELDNLNGICVNSYKPDDPALNAVFQMSASSMGICK